MILKSLKPKLHVIHHFPKNLSVSQTKPRILDHLVSSLPKPPKDPETAKIKSSHNSCFQSFATYLNSLQVLVNLLLTL